MFNRHHTNVLYARNKIADMREVDPWVQNVMREVEDIMPELREVVKCG